MRILQVKGLPSRSSDSSLRDAILEEFCLFGDITKSDVKIMNCGNANSRRYAWVMMDSESNAMRAHEALTNLEILGNKVVVTPQFRHSTDIIPKPTAGAELHREQGRTERLQRPRPDVHMERTGREDRRKKTACLCVYNLPESISASNLHTIFCKFGNLSKIRIFPPGHDNIDHYAIIVYKNAECGLQAARVMNHGQIDGHFIKTLVTGDEGKMADDQLGYTSRYNSKMLSTARNLYMKLVPENDVPDCMISRSKSKRIQRYNVDDSPVRSQSFHTTTRATADSRTSGSDIPPMRGMYIGNLCGHVTEVRLRQEFTQFGKIASVSIKGAYGFIHYEEMGSVLHAINDKNGRRFCCNNLKLGFGNAVYPPTNCVLLTNVTDTYDEEHLCEKFQKGSYGLRCKHAILDKNRRWALVYFRNVADAQEIVTHVKSNTTTDIHLNDLVFASPDCEEVFYEIMEKRGDITPLEKQREPTSFSSPVTPLLPESFWRQSSTYEQPSSSEVKSSKDEQQMLGVSIRNLPTRLTDGSLKAALNHEFKRNGVITSVVIFGKDHDRYAVVNFATSTEAKRALNCHMGKQFLGVKLFPTLHPGVEADRLMIANKVKTMWYEAQPKASRVLYLGNMPGKITETMLKERLECFGKILSIQIVDKTMARDMQESSVFAFIEFPDVTCVVLALRSLSKPNAELIPGLPFKLGFGRSFPTSCMWLAGLSPTVTSNIIKNKVLDTHKLAVKHIVINSEKKEALVAFHDSNSAQAVVDQLRKPQDWTAFVNSNVTSPELPYEGKLMADYASERLQEYFFEVKNRDKKMQRSDDLGLQVSPKQSQPSSIKDAKPYSKAWSLSMPFAQGAPSPLGHSSGAGSQSAPDPSEVKVDNPKQALAMVQAILKGLKHKQPGLLQEAGIYLKEGKSTETENQQKQQYSQHSRPSHSPSPSRKRRKSSRSPARDEYSSKRRSRSRSSRRSRSGSWNRHVGSNPNYGNKNRSRSPGFRRLSRSRSPNRRHQIKSWKKRSRTPSPLPKIRHHGFGRSRSSRSRSRSWGRIRLNREKQINRRRSQTRSRSPGFRKSRSNSRSSFMSGSLDWSDGSFKWRSRSRSLDRARSMRWNRSRSRSHSRHVSPRRNRVSRSRSWSPNWGRRQSAISDPRSHNRPHSNRSNNLSWSLSSSRSRSRTPPSWSQQAKSDLVYSYDTGTWGSSK